MVVGFIFGVLGYLRLGFEVMINKRLLIEICGVVIFILFVLMIVVIKLFIIFFKFLFEILLIG